VTFDLQQLPPNLRDAVAAALAAERAEKERFAGENRVLREMVRLLHLKKFGPKSEKLSDRQLVLLDGEPCVTPEEVKQEAERVTRDPAAGQPRVAKADRQHPGRVELPAHLERRIKVIPVPADQCHSPRCQKELLVIGYEQSEFLDMEPV